MTDDRNALKIDVWRGSSLANIPALVRAQSIEYATGYPGGLYLDGSFFLPELPNITPAIRANDFVQMWCGLDLAYEGYVSGIEISVQKGAVGWRVNMLGPWANNLMRRSIAKPWADKRLEENVWVYNTSATAALKCDTDRENRIALLPKGVEWINGEYAAVNYTVPAGQTIKRVTFARALAVGAGSWQVALARPGVAYDWTSSVAGSSSEDVTLPAPAQTVSLNLLALATQTPVEDGSVYGIFSNVTIYTETGAIDPQQVCIDCAGYAGLSADVSRIGALTDSIVPYIALPATTLADIVTEAAAYGAAAFTGWAVQVGKSTNSSDGLPPLELAAIPPLTQHDYSMWLDRANCGAGVRFVQDLSEVINSYRLSYTDAAGIERYLSSSDDAALADAASITAYGTRQSENISVDTTASAMALQYGKTRLAQTKDLKWKASGDIPVTGWIDTASGGRLPAALVQAGKVLRVPNYLNDIAGTSLSLLVTGTRYNHDTRTVTLSTGYPDTLAEWLARQLRGRV